MYDKPLTLKVAKHSSDNFPVGTKMVGDSFVSDFQFIFSFEQELSFSEEFQEMQIKR